LRHHPNERVFIHSDTLPIDFFHRFTTNGYQVYIRRFDFEKYDPNAPGYDWIQKKEKWKVVSPYYHVHIADFWRLHLIWKYGGSYVDFDHIFTKSFADLHSAVGTEHCHVGCMDFKKLEPSFPGLYKQAQALGMENTTVFLANGLVIRFPPKEPALELALCRLIKQYTPTDWGTIGPALWTLVFGEMPGSLQIQRPEEFFPFAWSEVGNVLNNKQADVELEKKLLYSHGFHLFRGSAGQRVNSPNIIFKLLKDILAFGELEGMIKVDFNYNDTLQL
jgi:hypothetical protein